MKVKDQLKHYDCLDVVYVCADVNGTLDLMKVTDLGGIDLDYEVLYIENAYTNMNGQPMKPGEQDLVVSYEDYMDILRRRSILEREKFKQGDFADDEEKMRDFRELTKAQFLESYSYLTEEEYDNTMKIEMESCRDEIANVIDHLDRIDIRLGDNEWKLHYTIGNCIDQLEGAMYELMYGEE